jgi:hypothetical protein
MRYGYGIWDAENMLKTSVTSKCIKAYEGVLDA